MHLCVFCGFDFQTFRRYERCTFRIVARKLIASDFVLVCSYSSSTSIYIDIKFSRTFILHIQSQRTTEANITFLEHRAGERHRTYVLEVYEQCVNSTDIMWLRARLQHYTNTYRIFNVIAMLQMNDGAVRMYTYSPYADEMIQLRNEAYRLHELFPDKIDFNGRPLHVSLFPEEVRAVMNALPRMLGPDADFAYLLAEKLNATLVVHRPPDALEYGNPTSTQDASGSLGQVVRREVDISLNSRFMRFDLFRENNIAEPTNTIGRDDMCLIVPLPKFMSPIHNLLHSLDVTVWTLTFLVIFPFTFLLHFAAAKQSRRIHTDFHRFRLLDAVRCYFNQTLTRLPATSRLRSIIILWIAYCFIMTNIFQSCLTSTFTVKILEKEIHNIDDLIKSDYTIVAAVDYGHLISRYFKGGLLTGQGKLLEKMRLVEWPDYNRMIDDNNTHYAYVNKFHLTVFYANAKIIDGLPMYRAIKECPVPFLACYIVPFGSPLLGRLNAIIGHLEQAGIFRFWERRVNADANRASVIPKSGHPMPLQLKQMFSFYFLFGGLVTAFAVFLAEKTIWKWNESEESKNRTLTHLDFVHQTLVDLHQRFNFCRKRN